MQVSERVVANSLFKGCFLAFGQLNDIISLLSFALTGIQVSCRVGKALLELGLKSGEVYALWLSQVLLMEHMSYVPHLNVAVTRPYQD